MTKIDHNSGNYVPFVFALTLLMRSCINTQVQSHYSSHVVFHTVCDVASHKIDNIYACAIAVQTFAEKCSQAGKENGVCTDSNEIVQKNTNHEFPEKIVTI